MMTLTEIISVCFFAGATGWATGLLFYTFRRSAFQILG